MATSEFTGADCDDYGIERKWYELTGIDQGTGIEFDGEEYAITEDGKILDSDAYPLTPGDWIFIAVNNTID